MKAVFRYRGFGKTEMVNFNEKKVVFKKMLDFFLKKTHCSALSFTFSKFNLAILRALNCLKSSKKSVEYRKISVLKTILRRWKQRKTGNNLNKTYRKKTKDFFPKFLVKVVVNF